MIVIVLYGAYRKLYGKEFKMAVDNLPAAIRLLEANFPGKFAKQFTKDSFHVCRGRHVGKHINIETEDMLKLTAKDGEYFHLIPAMSGAASAAKRKGIGAILLGALIIGASFFLFATPFMPGVYAGLALALGGASLLLTPDVQAKNEDKEKSYSFDGPVNVMAQGATKPLIYGRARVGSVVAAGSIDVMNVVK